MATCPYCKGPHNLSQCPRWRVGQRAGYAYADTPKRGRAEEPRLSEQDISVRWGISVRELRKLIREAPDAPRPALAHQSEKVLYYKLSEIKRFLDERHQSV